MQDFATPKNPLSIRIQNFLAKIMQISEMNEEMMASSPCSERSNFSNNISNFSSISNSPRFHSSFMNHSKCGTPFENLPKLYNGPIKKKMPTYSITKRPDQRQILEKSIGNYILGQLYFGQNSRKGRRDSKDALKLRLQLLINR